MKALFFSLLLLIPGSILCELQAQFITHTSVMRITGVKDGKQFEWENKDIMISLDYQTGEFISSLNNDGFMSTDWTSEAQSDSIISERTITLTGTFPINEIIDQQHINQDYGIELELQNDDLIESKTILFDMLVIIPESNPDESFRTFSLSAILHNNELDLPAFEGFENEIRLWLMFSGNINVQ